MKKETKTDDRNAAGTGGAGGSIPGIRQYNKNASSATSTTEDTQETVLDVNSDDITSFRYVYEGETYAFEKEDDTCTMRTIIP